MNPPRIQTKNLQLVPQTRKEVRACIEPLPPHDRAEVSPAWLALLDASSAMDPWIHGFSMLHKTSKSTIGRCGFKGPPTADGTIEIAYGVAPGHQGKGYATEAAAALVTYAFSHERVRLARAHTLPEPNTSTHVLTECGFRRTGEVIDPEDGLVWRWEKTKLD